MSGNRRSPVLRNASNRIRSYCPPLFANAAAVAICAWCCVAEEYEYPELRPNGKMRISVEVGFSINPQAIRHSGKNQ